MIVSVNWIKQFVEFDGTVADLATLIGTRLVEVEHVVALKEKYDDVLVVNVVSCDPIEGSDHLNVVRIDDGGEWRDVERGDDGLVQVVCGAPNIAVGQKVAWLPPTSVVPESFGTAEPFVLGVRPLRGVISNGMIASAKELDLYDDHAGILVLDDTATPGQKLADVLALDDYLLDIENKSLTHRPDAFGIIGFAREVAGIQGKAFHSPEWLARTDPTVQDIGTSPSFSVQIDEPGLSDRYSAVLFEKVSKDATTPLVIRSLLAKSGVRPISPIVDVTNYLMLLSGQPLHAFDYDKVKAVSGGRTDIHVRSAHDGEQLALLDGRTVTMTPEDIVIAAGETAIALGGAMGGAATEIDDSTTTIILESATFDLYRLRAVQMRHGIFSEAITRLTKGQPAELSARVMHQAVTLFTDIAGLRVVSGIVEDYPRRPSDIVINVPFHKVNDILGTHYSADQMSRTLNNVEIHTELDDDRLVARIPYWRTDLHIDEDIAEEIGRLNGFDAISDTLPVRPVIAVSPSRYEQLRDILRQVLVRAGANEVLTYSFIHGDVMKKAAQQPEQAYRIVNSISPDLQYYRQSLTPSLLALVRPNIKAGYESFALFESNKFHTKLRDTRDDGIPNENESLGFVLATTRHQSSAAFYDAKRYLEFTASQLGVSLAYAPLEDDNDYPVSRPFEPRRSARVSDALTGKPVGIVGEYRQSVQRGFKLPTSTAGFEISVASLLELGERSAYSFAPGSKYPGTSRDVCFRVEDQTTYGSLVDAIAEYLGDLPLMTSQEPIDIYQAANDSFKNITIRISLTAADRTLTNDEANTVMTQVIQAVTDRTGASVV